MRKADRLFQLVNLIRIHQPISAERLASRIGVSVRSIYRYIDDLSFSGIPIYGTTGVGYALDADFEMPPLTLNRLELDALMLGMEMLSASADNDLSAAARMLLSKISASLVHHKVDPSTAKNQGTWNNTFLHAWSSGNASRCHRKHSGAENNVYPFGRCGFATPHLPPWSFLLGRKVDSWKLVLHQNGLPRFSGRSHHLHRCCPTTITQQSCP